MSSYPTNSHCCLWRSAWAEPAGDSGAKGERCLLRPPTRNSLRLDQFGGASRWPACLTSAPWPSLSAIKKYPNLSSKSHGRRRTDHGEATSCRLLAVSLRWTSGSTPGTSTRHIISRVRCPIRTWRTSRWARRLGDVAWERSQRSWKRCWMVITVSRGQGRHLHQCLCAITLRWTRRRWKCCGPRSQRCSGSGNSSTWNVSISFQGMSWHAGRCPRTLRRGGGS